MLDQSQSVRGMEGWGAHGRMSESLRLKAKGNEWGSFEGERRKCDISQK